jgi:ABC-type Mn2+/Zn2+ transport system permease subunit
MDELSARAIGVMALAGAQCGLIGVFVYLLNIPFIGVAIAHASMAGGIWAVIFGLPGKAGAFALSIITAIFAGPISDRAGTKTNISFGIIFSLAMGFAFLGAGIMPGGMQNASGYLWGSVFLADTRDMVFMSVSLLVTGLFLAVFYRQVSAVLFNRDMAAANGINDRLFFYCIMLLTGVTVAANLNIIGGLMLFALIIIPPAIARRLTRDLKTFAILSAIAGLVCAVVGTSISLVFNLPVSATVVLFNCAMYALSLLIRHE